MNQRTIYVAGGCFWGMEELFKTQAGVIKTEVGYTGGLNNNPTYENHPGHAEAIAITYDITKTTFKELLDFFFRIHNPTTLNKQQNDIGESYRSAIFYQTDEEYQEAEAMINKVNESKLYDHPVVTTLEKFDKFYSAEEYHQDYLKKNPGGYTCHFIRTNKSLLDK